MSSNEDLISLSRTADLPYYIAGEIEDRNKLIVMTPENFWQRSRVYAHVNHEVISISRGTKTVRVKGSDGIEQDMPYDRLILSQGANPSEQS